MMDREILRGWDGILSTPLAELHFMVAKAFSHHSGITGDRCKHDDGE